MSQIHRNSSIDSIRAFLIIYIITIIHGCYWLGLAQGEIRSFLLFEMTGIFIVTGYSFALFCKNTHFTLSLKSYCKYALARSTRILVPYIAYAFFCCLFILYVEPSKNVWEALISWLNPVTHGKGYSSHLLSAHLWFILPFLAITLALPFVLIIRIPPRYIPIFAIVLCLLISYLNNTLFSKAITPLYYFFWAWVGYQIASGCALQKKQYAFLLLLFLTTLCAASIFFNADLNMQSNKFPPNSTFFIFNSIWLCFFMLIFSYLPGNYITTLFQKPMLKVFITAGYSIYLWQGMGYSIAVLVSDIYNMNKLAVWFVAIVLSTLLGKLFSPLEKIKIKLT